MKLNAPVYKVDFRQDPDDRWDELLADSWACRKARTLCRAMGKQVEEEASLLGGHLPALLAKTAKSLAGTTLGSLDYISDMEVWSERAVGNIDQVILGNFAYELHQAHGGMLRGISNVKEPVQETFDTARDSAGNFIASGKEQVDKAVRNLRKWTGLCTSVAFHQPGLGMIHGRNLDWPLKQMKDATIILDCKSSAGPFKVVSVPGMVGVLSGVARGRFSITINSNDFSDHVLPLAGGWSAALLVRWIFEHCASYDEALRELKRASGFFPFFATLTGLKRGQAVVVEVNMKAANRYYQQPGEAVAVANHFPTDTFEDEESNSLERQELIEKAANRCAARTLTGCFSVVNEVLHSNTVQSMVMHPRTGEVLVQQL